MTQAHRRAITKSATLQPTTMHTHVTIRSLKQDMDVDGDVDVDADVDGSSPTHPNNRPDVPIQVPGQPLQSPPPEGHVHRGNGGGHIDRGRGRDLPGYLSSTPTSPATQTPHHTATTPPPRDHAAHTAEHLHHQHHTVTSPGQPGLLHVRTGGVLADTDEYAHSSHTHVHANTPPARLPAVVKHSPTRSLSARNKHGMTTMSRDDILNISGVQVIPGDTYLAPYLMAMNSLKYRATVVLQRDNLEPLGFAFVSNQNHVR